MLDLKNCIVLYGADLTPHHCDRLVVMPGLYNCHTLMSDSCLPDGATGMTLERLSSAAASEL